MPFQPDPETTQILSDLNATYRCTGIAPPLGRDDDGKMTPIGPSKYRAEIIDMTLNVPFASAEAGSKAEAVRLAAQAAVTAPKPLTPAQRAELARTGNESLVLAEQRAEIERLKAELAARTGDDKGDKRTAGGGRSKAAAAAAG